MTGTTGTRPPAKPRRLKLTLAFIRSKCDPPGPDERTSTGQPIRQRIYWDTEVRGFGFVARPPTNGARINGSFIASS